MTDQRLAFVLHCFTQSNEIRICPSSAFIKMKDTHFYVTNRNETIKITLTSRTTKNLRDCENFFRAIRKR